MAGGLDRVRLQSSVDDIRSSKFWRGVIAEFIGCIIFLFVAVGGIRFMGQGLGTNSGLHIGMAVGLTLATVIWICAEVSGAHLNPAVTLAALVTRRVSVVKFFFYVAAQTIGAIIGVGFLKGVSPNSMTDNMACTLISDKITVGQGFLIEVIITFNLVMTVFAACDSARNDLKGSAALAIGIAVFVGHLFALNYTGASMNPARSIGSAAIEGNFKNHWVYWLAPALGAIIAGLLYETVFAANTSRRRILAWLKDAEYDPDMTDSVNVTADRKIPLEQNQDTEMAAAS